MIAWDNKKQLLIYPWQETHKWYITIPTVIYVHVNVKIHPMHDTSPAHQQGKKQEYHIDYLQRLVNIINILFIVHNTIWKVSKGRNASWIYTYKIYRNLRAVTLCIVTVQNPEHINDFYEGRFFTWPPLLWAFMRHAHRTLVLHAKLKLSLLYLKLSLN